MPKTRAVALLAGTTRYFTGVPCPKGHVAPRRASSGGCIECANAVSRRYAAKPETKAKKQSSRAVWKERPETKEKFRRYSKQYMARLRSDPVKHEAHKRKFNMRRDGIYREHHIEERLTEAVKAIGGFCPKFVDPSRRGAPDRMVIVRGHPVYFVELKRPKRAVVAIQQTKYHEELARHGHAVTIIKTLEGVDAFMARFN